jgi:hypothetical protein
LRSMPASRDMYGLTRGIFAKEQHYIEDKIRFLSDLAENANIGGDDARPLHSFKKLEKLTVSDERSFETIEWEWMGYNLTATAQLAVRENAVTRLLEVLQAVLLRAPVHLDELCAE